MEAAVAAAAKMCTSSVEDMPREIVNHLYETGAVLVFKDVPEGTEFGIDYKSWNVGPKFLGLKMIPPGVHFIYFSVKTAPRIGFFYHFKEREIILRKWDRRKEDMLIEATDSTEIERLRSNLKNIDCGLAPYPYECYRKWFALSNHITEETVERLKPESQHGRITGQAELVTMETEMMENESGLAHSSSQVDREHPTRIRFIDEQGLPIMRIRPGFQIRFTDIAAESISYESSKRNTMDHSWQLEKILERVDGKWTEFLGEMQFAYICFLIGQVYEGFEQWKRLIHLLCSCTKALVDHKDLYMTLLAVIHFQLKECPKDFFVDIVSRSNFLTTTLSNLFGNINDCEQCDPSLKEKANKFKTYLSKNFKWDFDISAE